ncbi:MAG: alcohol dehydrogenase catalytic domain-containing protein [Chromatiaceae bacterium]|nr:alcohol dehydrogenase catalytic domain-containing protein [Chromatiaceae bacterium]
MNSRLNWVALSSSPEVEIEVDACSICHSDPSMLENARGISRFPFVPGHEVSVPAA